ncbi:unnamed protein product [Lymnaea stagnalis]|uniref:Angiotensin-converting enzyme n=1 Tax=Lymnaea stagnalis TaxID=6523 RepID=A0AAV2HP44_LYMST
MIPFLLWLFCVFEVKGQSLISDPVEIKAFLDNYDIQAKVMWNRVVESSWTYNTNITDHNQKHMLEVQLVSARFVQEMYQNATRFNLTVMSPLDRRRFVKIMDIGTAAQTNETKLAYLNKIKSDMQTIYSKAKVLMPSGKSLPLDPDLINVMATSRNYDELLAAWVGWREASGAKMKTFYSQFVELSNEAVQKTGYADTGAHWRSDFETPTFEDDVRALFDQLRPLYEQLHAYARRKLKQIYGNDKFPSSGHIPAHLLGNMWGQQWDALVKELTPFKGKSSFDVTGEMGRQNYTALRIFQTADDFFKSLGMIPMPDTFWNKSLLEKPKDGRDVVCHASAWDFFNGRDFRIKQCTVITVQDLETAHHEMGHVEYYLQYKDQPVSFRRGANSGFHEAVGDVISLSVQTPEHLHSIGLIPTVGKDAESDINFLMNMALQKIAFLPFGYLIDQWRWSVFRGDTKPDRYNDEWWNLRCRYQGLSPPVYRSSSDFDPGAKYHIPANVPYIRYFVSFVIQFQFHKALCHEAGYRGPLHRCDIYNSKTAGTLLSNMLKLGSSKPWPEAMYLLTGQYKMDAQPLMDYFKPLLEYLRQENGNDYGWHPQCPTLTPGHAARQMVKSYLDNFDPQAEIVFSTDAEVSWIFYSNITDYNQRQMLNQQLVTAKFAQEAYTNATRYNLTVMSPRDRRLFIKIMDIGTAAQTNETKLALLNKIISDMETIYSTAKVTMPFGKNLTLDQDLQEIMVNSRNYEELLAAWVGWRAESGAKMKQLYAEYVELSNEANTFFVFLFLTGHADTGAYWRSWFETPTFEDDVRALFDQLRPLYEQLHAYARRKLKQIYGNDRFPSSGHIPAHLLGNMWGQQWNNLGVELTPFKGKPSLDVTHEMVRQNYTALKIFQTANDFFKSLGMIEMPDSFWKDSLLEKPEDGRDLVCHASAWDFSNRKDFRIKQCIVITAEDLETAHHEMGHIEYFLQYKDLPVCFRDGASPGFHEAVGDVISLSVQTPGYLHAIGLIPSPNYDEQSDINFLTSMALNKVAFLPFGYLIDQWRWSVFRGDTTPDKYNDEWWNLRCKYQGLSSPVPRNPSDFDPGAKYHIPADVPYINLKLFCSYFVSYIIQFQFHKALCDASGHRGPLYKCHIYNSKAAAGTLLSDTLKLGSSKPWPEAMNLLTGQYKMDAQPLMDFFKPLLEYLRQEDGDDYGWNPQCPTFT